MVAMIFSELQKFESRPHPATRRSSGTTSSQRLRSDYIPTHTQEFEMVWQKQTNCSNKNLKTYDRERPFSDIWPEYSRNSTIVSLISDLASWNSQMNHWFKFWNANSIKDSIKLRGTVKNCWVTTWCVDFLPCFKQCVTEPNQPNLLMLLGVPNKSQSRSRPNWFFV